MQDTATLDRAEQATGEDLAASAAAVALTYGSDAEPGIWRRRAGRGFVYVRADGRRVVDAASLDAVQGAQA